MHTLTTLLSTLQNSNTFRDLGELHGRLSGILSEQGGKTGGRGALENWAPAVDIAEDDRGYLIKIEVPGVKKEDVRVTVEDSLLTATGERKLEGGDDGRRYHRIERGYGSFSRSFSLPSDADASKVEAGITEGVLNIVIGKSETAKPRQIEVKTY